MCIRDRIQIQRLRPAGAKKMKVADYLVDATVNAGDQLG